jgi:hypothetical protein
MKVNKEKKKKEKRMPFGGLTPIFSMIEIRLAEMRPRRSQ